MQDRTIPEKAAPPAAPGSTRHRLEGEVGPILPAEVTAMRMIRRDGSADLPESPARKRLVRREWITRSTRNPREWVLTPAGREALQATDSFGDPG